MSLKNNGLSTGRRQLLSKFFSLSRRCRHGTTIKQSLLSALMLVGVDVGWYRQNPPACSVEKADAATPKLGGLLSENTVGLISGCPLSSDTCMLLGILSVAGQRNGSDSVEMPRSRDR